MGSSSVEVHQARSTHLKKIQRWLRTVKKLNCRARCGLLLLMPDSQTRTKPETAGKIMSTSIDVRKSRERTTALASISRKSTPTSVQDIGLRPGTTSGTVAPSLARSKHEGLIIEHLHSSVKGPIFIE